MGPTLSKSYEAKVQPHSQPGPEFINKAKAKLKRKRKPEAEPKPKTKRDLNILRIPLEIRELIYQHLFTSTAISPYIRGCGIRSLNRQRTNTIILVCRQTYLEARPLLFRHCLFDFTAPLFCNVYARSSYISSEDNTHVDGRRMTAQDLCLVQRMHGSYNLLHCLTIAQDRRLPETMTNKIFPGLRVADLSLRELTIEITVVEHMAFNARRRRTATARRDRRRVAVADREKISVVRKLQYTALPFRLYLLVYYASRARSCSRLARSGISSGVEDRPSFVVDPQGTISNDEGRLLLEDIYFRPCVLDAVKMYDVDVELENELGNEDENEDEEDEDGSEASSIGSNDVVFYF